MFANVRIVAVGLLSLLFAYSAAAQEKQADIGDAVKVMSFNLRYGNAKDGENRWEKRTDLVRQVIKENEPDLLGTQETLPFQARFLKRELKGFRYIGWSREKNPNGEQCAIFYRAARFKKVKAGQFWLSKTPEKKFSKDWDSSLPRVATWALLYDKKTKKELLFVNTHFDHRGKVARLESAKLIRSWIDRNYPDKPVILAGDFNASSQSQPYAALVDKTGLVDSYRSVFPARESKEGTFNGFRGRDAGARIDWILHSGSCKSVSAKIIRFHKDGRYPSDHFPVAASIVVRGGGETKESKK